MVLAFSGVLRAGAVLVPSRAWLVRSRAGALAADALLLDGPAVARLAGAALEDFLAAAARTALGWAVALDFAAVRCVEGVDAFALAVLVFGAAAFAREGFFVEVTVVPAWMGGWEGAGV